MNAFSFAPDRGIAVVSPSASGVPALSWSTGLAPKPGSTVPQTVATPTERPAATAEDVILLGTSPIASFTDIAKLSQLLQTKL